MKIDRESRKSMVQMAYASSIGIAMVLTVFGGLFFGSYLDRKFGGGHLFTFVFMILGILIGFGESYKLIKKYFRDDFQVIRMIKSEPHRKRPPPNKT